MQTLIKRSEFSYIEIRRFFFKTKIITRDRDTSY